MCLLLSRGHTGVYDYGWSWFVECVEATQRMDASESKRRMIEARIAHHADEKVWKQAMKGK